MMKLNELNSDGFAALKAAWLAMINPAAHPVIDAEYRQLFERIAGGALGSLKDCINKSLFSCVKDDGTHMPWAIVELVQTRNGTATWVKMLDIHMSPQIEGVADTEAATDNRLNVFTAALIGIFELTKGIKGVDTVKVYGRTDALVTFLRGMRDAFTVITMLGTIKGVAVSIEGRWLVFRAV